MPIRVCFSNRFEVLLEGLLTQLAAEAPAPFERQTVIVPSIAVRRRIELAVADRFGICAQIDFPFLGQWLWQEVGQWMPAPERSPLDHGRLTWAILVQLGDAEFIAHHEALASYLADADAVMRFELAERIARVFEDAVTYRPDWVEQWRQRRPLNLPLEADSRTAAWQADLWRRVTGALGVSGQHPFIRQLQEAPQLRGTPASTTPVYVFALPALPPLHLDLLRAFASYRPLQLYTLNPCREHWFEIVPAKRLSFLAARGQADYHETGNRLLAAWGRQTQAHIDLLFENDDALEERGSQFDEASPHTLLGHVQNAVLDLQELAPGSFTPDAADRSIELHVCHSLTRQLEALQDRLLGLLASDNPIRPDQVLVVVPDLAAAAPLIDAVFGTAPPARRIPYTITGRGQTRENPVARTLAALLDLLPGRFAASAVFDLLQQRPIATRYRLDDAALETVRGWIAEAGIRWGLDAGQRGELGLPPADFHTFADGIERLYLAYALGDDACFGGRTGAGNPEGQAAQALGQLWRFVQDLGDTRQRWRQARSADAWRNELDALLERYIPAAFEWAEDLRALRATVAELHRQMSAAGEMPLPAEVVIRALADLLEQPARGGVPTGGLSFAAMASLRPLPYRMVCVLGLDDGAFPGADRPAEFDLLARHPRRGDRQRRFDDRNLFLDLLLGARELLYLSHTGRSLRDNAPLPPSVLVSELLDVLAEATAADPHDSASIAQARTRLIVEHPLQAFSRELFDPDGDARLRSHNQELCEALRAGRSGVASPALGSDFDSDERDERDGAEAAQPFFSAPLAITPDQRTVPLDALIRFFRHPCRALLRDRLGLQLTEGDEALDDQEPFVAGFHEHNALVRRLETEVLAGSPPERLRELAEAGNEYPEGAIGRTQREGALTELAWFSAALQPLRDEAALPPQALALDFTIEGEAWRLAGNLAGLRASGQLRYRIDALRPTDRIETLIRHWALCAASPAGVAPLTRHIASDGEFALEALKAEHAQAKLHTLLTHYRTGLTRPLHFFPKSAWAYIESGSNLRTARQKWEGGLFAGERDDAWYQLALRGVADPLDEEFAQCAEDVFGEAGSGSGE
ncbi:exodeoxyribonuclease V subunit gamma [Niveibacterium sp. 24ML]|uniref:exodeoxyribonuclease V subunit gamma n=1 Tax=Niveibacterium sp. 24ML TaxID=2985512 RepID=UPI002270FD31|nr:exodeoxyribonuclease V subunit gamma [Niveibacterium sp. 24ML]MCX9157219.1 exodeoxyribonuclease V subunit gamma [Niveibacterium sp. 24ML]